MSSPRPKLLNEVSFSQVSTNTSFPDEAAYYAERRCASPTPPRTGTDDGLERPQPYHDDGRSPSPEPFRNYEDMELRSASSQTSAPSFATATSDRSTRIRELTTRIEYLHGRHAPAGARESSQMRSQQVLPPSDRPRSPPAPCEPIPRHPATTHYSAERPRQPSMPRSGYADCLKEINESLDELHDLLPVREMSARDAHAMRINELCAKLDNLSTVAHEIRAAAKRRNLSRSEGDAVDRFLEEITRKADSMAYLLENLESPVPSRPVSRSVSSRPRSAQTERTSKRSEKQHYRDAVRVNPEYRRLLEKEHTETVMDTLEMLTDTVLRIADRVDTHHEALALVITAQKEQLEAYEESKMMLQDVMPEEDSESQEGGYVEASQLTAGSGNEAGFRSADRFSESSSRRAMTPSQLTSTASNSSLRPLLASVVVNSQYASVSPRRTAPHRRIQTPGTSSAAVAATGTTTESLLMSSRRDHGETRPAKTSTEVLPPRFSARKQFDDERCGTPASADVSRSLFIERASTASVHSDQEVSRSLFVDDASSTASHGDRGYPTASKAAYKHASPVDHTSKASNLRSMYKALRAENDSLKQQLELALDQKDQWRHIVEENMHSVVV